MPGAAITLDLDRLELRDAGGARVALRRQAMAVLHCLARQPDRTITKDELMRAVWPGVVVTDDSLVQCVRDIRRALGDLDHRIVQTEARRGYRLVRPLPPTPRSDRTSDLP
jgi:DNA-binding winged helix-turn-helix (wHTH) protein